MVDEGVFLSILMGELEQMGYHLSEKDKRHFQREFWLVGNSHRRPHQEKINVIENMIQDAINTVEKMVEFMNQTDRRIQESRKSKGPSCLPIKVQEIESRL